MNRDLAIRNTHPTVVTLDAEKDAWDEDGAVVILDEAKIASEMTKLQLAYDGLAYSRARAKMYPPIGDQLDALWKGGDDAAAMKVIIDKVKSDNPKG